MTAPSGPAGRRTGVRSLGTPVLAWSGVAAVIVGIQYLVGGVGRSASDAWVRWDGGAYIEIIQQGYHDPALDRFPLIAWFPGYPLLVRWVADLTGLTVLTGTPVAAAVLVSLAAGLTATVLYWTWVGRRAPSAAQLTALGVFLLYAYSWFLFGVIYGDALFVALALGAFLLVDRDRRWASVVLAGATCAVRPVGFAVALGVLVVVLERDGVVVGRWKEGVAARLDLPRSVGWRQLRWQHLALLATSLWGVIAYSVYLWDRWGSPLLWLSAQQSWQQGPTGGPKTWFKLGMFAQMIREHDPGYVAKNVGQTLIFLAVLAAVPAISRAYGRGYGVYVLALLFIIGAGANELLGSGRYLIAAFPFWALVGTWLSTRRRITILYLAASAGLLVFQTVLFAQGAYLT